MSTNFLKTDPTSLGYLWNDSANWTNGVPVAGEQVVFDVDPGDLTTPGGTDNIPEMAGTGLDIAGLELQGDLAIATSLTIDALSTAGTGQSLIAAASAAGEAPASLAIKAVSGAAGQFIIAATGAGATVDMDAASDPGEA